MLRHLAWLTTLLALGPVAPSLAAASLNFAAPIDPYPQSAPSSIGASRPPLFVDDDETVRVKLRPDGSASTLVDDVLIKLRGSGDYVLFLPGQAIGVSDLGGDSVPGLQEGHVSFLGNFTGQSQLGAEAALEASAAKELPLAVKLTYVVAGQPTKPEAIPNATSPITMQIGLANLTAATHTFYRGAADKPTLAQTLDDLRQAPAFYTPETDLGSLLPLPRTLPMRGPVQAEQHDTYVPLVLSVRVKLEAAATVRDAGGADVAAQPVGTTLTWVRRLPGDTASGGADTLAFTYTAPHPRLPAIEVRAEASPLPASLFTAPGGGAWTAFLARVPDTSALTVLAQAGTASLHRIGDLVPPLGRPGTGPVKVKYDFVLDSGRAASVRPPAEPPVHGQAWAILLVSAALIFGIANAAWAWSRH